MKKILITGNSGYIGSHLSKLLEKEYEVHGLDINPPQHPVSKFYQIDINRHFELPEHFDAVIHLAALVNVGESEQMPIKYYITNMNGTMNVLNKISCDNFIFASTGAAEGCESAYGISKRAAEDVVREFCTVHSPKNFTTFRFYNVIGTDGYQPTNPDGLMSNLIKAIDTGEFTVHGTDYDTIHGDGSCVRDYVHVMEVCDSIKTAIEQPSNKIECLGHGVGYTVKEMARIFRNVNDVDFCIKSGPRRKGDLPSSVLEEVSPYMRNLYTMEELLKIN